MSIIINIHKVAGQKKDAIRVNNVSDIPEFLQKTITIADGMLHLECVEGNETAPLGSVIGYEQSARTASGWNTWCIGNAATNLVEVDGVFYKKATVLPAILVPKADDEQPDWAKACNLTYNGDGTATFKTDWGFSTGRIGRDFLLLYGMKEDGSPDANILIRGEKSYYDYIVCDEGTDIGKLSELYPA